MFLAEEKEVAEAFLGEATDEALDLESRLGAMWS
jgi:hypothetical protein